MPMSIQYLSSRLLNALTDGDITTCSGSWFQSVTTRWLNEYFRITRRHLETASFRLWSQRPWPLVESWKNRFLSKFSRSVIILNASIRSPLRLVVSKVVRPSWLSLSSYLRVFRWGTIFVAARWTFSRIWISFGRWGDHAEHSTPCVVRAWVSYSTFYRFGRLSR